MNKYFKQRKELIENNKKLREEILKLEKEKNSLLEIKDSYNKKYKKEIDSIEESIDKNVNYRKRLDKEYSRLEKEYGK